MLVFKSPVAASPTPRPQRRLTKTAEEMAEEAEELEALVAGVRRELQVTLHACRRVLASLQACGSWLTVSGCLHGACLSTAASGSKACTAPAGPD